jgi:hypothetical protein
LYSIPWPSELNGLHQFKDDKKYGDIMFRMREGIPTLDDLKLINAHGLANCQRGVPSNIPVAVYQNRNQEATNTAMFEEYC